MYKVGKKTNDGNDSCGTTLLVHYAPTTIRNSENVKKK